MIKTGEKKEEYREIKPFYTSRFQPFLKSYAPIHVRLKNGYRTNSPSIDILCRIGIGSGFPKWGAEDNKDDYILFIDKVYEATQTRLIPLPAVYELCMGVSNGLKFVNSNKQIESAHPVS